MAAPVHAWDEVFIRCRREHVNGVLTHVGGWGEWWPGVSSTSAGEQSFDLALTSRFPVPARQHVRLTVSRVRPRDKGLEFTVAGDVTGEGEWFHLDQPAGVVVNYLLRASTTRHGHRRWLAAHRAIVRAGLVELKARMEQGRVPGAEPDPALLAWQAQELEIFAREVAAHEAGLRPAGGETKGS